MRDNYSQIVLDMADYILKTRCTVRQCASVFGIGKSTVHSYMRTKLKYIDIDLYDEVQQVLSYNLSVRHLRGGESTKKKYLAKKTTSDCGDQTLYTNI
ncbi:MAG: sporulation transcriptional regulator SpoIIID [Clostridia bacterium]|nr:sporulation transcriptional regulator SpoIIID [Clostridia bacterium]